MADVYDTPWKDMLDRYFEDFMAFFFPEAHADVDWSQPCVSCDGELRKLARDAELGKRFADKLMRVVRRNGEHGFAMIHSEIQVSRQSSLPERTYVYNYRIYDRHHLPVASFVILGDDDPKWRPDRYEYEIWGCRPGLDFPMVKLLDYNEQWAELEASTNLFAMVVMAHLEVRATRGDGPGRLSSKVGLIRRLYRSGLGRDQVLDLLNFIDWVMELPAELVKPFEAEVDQLETELEMPYVNTWERRGIEKGVILGKQEGIEQGVEQGVRQGEALFLKGLLVHRFGSLPEWAERRLAKASREELERWGKRVLEARTLEEVFAA
jgi:hypothetical protein